MVFWICGWQFSQIFFNNRAGCFPLGLSWNPVRAEHGLSKDVQGTAPGRKVRRGGGVRVPRPWTSCVARTCRILDAETRCILQPTVREMVSKVYTFLMSLGQKDLWNFSEG